LQAKAVRLADYSIATHTAQLLGDLACGHPAFPHFSELLDALVGPGH